MYILSSLDKLCHYFCYILYLISHSLVPTSCNMSYFRCDESSSQSQCVPWPYVCDSDSECNDESDESPELCKYFGKCGGTITNPNGLLTSPSYPYKYPHKAQCIYLISQPNGTYVNISFISMDVKCQERYSPGQNYIEMRDGN